MYDMARYMAATEIVFTDDGCIEMFGSTFEYDGSENYMSSPSFVYTNWIALHPMWF